MTYLEAATELLSQHTYRMSVPEKAACQAVKDGESDDDSCRILRGLMTEFARELAAARPIEPVAPIETADQEGGALL